MTNSLILGVHRLGINVSSLDVKWKGKCNLVRNSSRLRKEFTKRIIIHATESSAVQLPVTEDNDPSILVEIQECKQLVRNIGRGVVFIGSSRIPEEHEFFHLTRDLACQIGKLLGSPIWSGVGPGLMDASVQGAMDAQIPAAGLKILLEAMETNGSWNHPYLPKSHYITCESIAARKQGLLEAAKRTRLEEKTAFIAVPGGVGTLDEIFEVLTLIQLKKYGTDFPVPFIFMNYNGCFEGLFTFFKDLEKFGAVKDGEIDGLCKVFQDNSSAVKYLKEFYKDN